MNQFIIPVNRWTVGAVVALLVLFGNDFVEPIKRAIAILTAASLPAY